MYKSSFFFRQTMSPIDYYYSPIDLPPPAQSKRTRKTRRKIETSYLRWIELFWNRIFCFFHMYLACMEYTRNACAHNQNNNKMIWFWKLIKLRNIIKFPGSVKANETKSLLSRVLFRFVLLLLCFEKSEHIYKHEIENSRIFCFAFACFWQRQMNVKKKQTI